MKNSIKILTVFTILSTSVIQVFASITEVETKSGSLIVDFELPNYVVKDTNLLESYSIDEDYTYIEAPEMGLISDLGYPQLPQRTVDVLVPDDATGFTVSVSNIQTTTINCQFPIFPAQENFTDDIPLFVRNDNYYNSNGSLFAFTHKLSTPYRIMGANGISLSIFPFQYNPSTGVLTVINSCKFTLSFSGATIDSTDTTPYNIPGGETSETQLYFSKVFDNYSKAVLRSTSANTVESATISDRGNYLIISAPEYVNTLTYFANYKRNIGYNVTVVSTTTTGTSAASIKSYIQNLYNNKLTRPRYVLLVGNYQKIPQAAGSTSSSDDVEDQVEDAKNPVTDLNYVLLDGDDLFADAFIGRFAITNVTDLRIQLEKTMRMETTLHMVNKKVTLLSGGGHGKENFKDRQEWVRKEIFQPLGYSATTYYSSGSNLNYDQIDEAMNSTADISVYYGHGGYTEYSSQFNWATITTPLETEIVPFVFAFSCLTNCYANMYGCFGSTLMRSRATTYFGSTTVVDSHHDTKIHDKLFTKLNSTSQMRPMINAGMKDYYKTFYVLLDNFYKKTPMKSYNLLGDPSIYLNGIGVVNNYSFTNNEVFHSGERINYTALFNISTAQNAATFEAQANSNVTLNSGHQILLKPGTKIINGAIFSAKVIHVSSAALRSSEVDSLMDSPPAPKEFNGNISDENIVNIYVDRDTKNMTLDFFINSTFVENMVVYDASGRRLKDIPINLPGKMNQSLDVNLGDINKGVYFYKIKYREGYKSGKLIL